MTGPYDTERQALDGNREQVDEPQHSRLGNLVGLLT